MPMASLEPPDTRRAYRPGTSRSPNRWVETNPWKFFLGYKRLK
jgi:hypothetical protein